MENVEPKNEKAPEWLQDLQNKSWEPEIIISGLSLTFLFLLPEKVLNFSVYLMYEWGFGVVISMLILLYTSAIIAFFKIFFVVHLLMRFAWTSLIGISYAFPNGVNQANIFKYLQGYRYPSPMQLVIKLEKICSILFAFPTVLGIIIFVFPVILFLLGLVLLTIGVSEGFSVFVVFGVLLLLFIAYILIIFAFKHSKLATWFATSFASSVSLIYSSNLGKWATNLFIVPIMLAASPFVYADLSNFKQYINNAKFDQEWVDKKYYYAPYADEGMWFPRVLLEQETVEGQVLTLSLAFIAQDQKRAEKVARGELPVPDSLGFISPPEQPTDFVRVWIDSIQFTDLQWETAKMPDSGQKAYRTWLNLAGLPLGAHRLRVDKLIFFDDGEAYIRKNWVALPFVKASDALGR